MADYDQSVEDTQGFLFSGSSWGSAPARNLPDLFRKIYFHLYTNSKASRAEVIIEDLSLLLLSKLAAEVNGKGTLLQQFTSGKNSADNILLPLLQESYPDLITVTQRFSLGEESLRRALADLQDVRLSDAPSHALGEAFQALIGPRLRGERGQFFTPRSLVRAMVEIIDPKPHENVLDPACGTGGFLSEAVAYQLSRYKTKELSGLVIGVDKDHGLARLAAAMLRVIANTRGQVFNFNSLSEGEWVEHTAHEYQERFDVVLTNPPFGTKIGLEDARLLKRFDFGHIWVQRKDSGQWVKTGEVAASQDPQILFLELCVNALKPQGRMGIVLPEGLFGNKGSSYIWDWLETRGEVYGMVDCPRTTFQPGTDTKTNVLFFRKGAPSAEQPARVPDTKVSVALHCGHDRRGRTHGLSGHAIKDDFPLIAEAFHNDNSQQSVWRSVALRGQRYLVPRYHYTVFDYTQTEKEILSDAKFATLGELVADGLITIRKGHEIGSEAYGTGDIPFVRTSDISNFEISSDPTKSVSEEIYAEYAPQQQLKTGDILMVVDGRYRIGTTALITDHNVSCVVQSHLRIIATLDETALEPYELLFALNLPSVKIHIRNLVFIQSTLGTLGNRLYELRVPLLHGDGAWLDRVNAFRQALKGRDELLAKLAAMTADDLEL